MAGSSFTGPLRIRKSDGTKVAFVNANGVLAPTGAGGAASASGLLFGIGTSASPATTSTADAKFIEVRAQSTAASGDNRLMYLRYALSGGGGGETVRAFTKVEASTGTARGAHISLDMGDTDGAITGLGVGVDAQLLMGNTAYTTGTWAALNAEIYADNSSTDVSGLGSIAFIRASINGGHATGKNSVEDNAYLISVAGGSNASGNMVGAVGNEPTWTSKTHLIRCDFNGTDVYLVGVQL